jgi:protocatechuate 4,5-dioxygenase alpha chain
MTVMGTRQPFDFDMAMKGYALNKMCHTFNTEAARKAFLADEDAYIAKFGLNAEEKAAVKSRDKDKMVKAGVNLYYFQKFSRMFSK